MPWKIMWIYLFIQLYKQDRVINFLINKSVSLNFICQLWQTFLADITDILLYSFLKLFKTKRHYSFKNVIDNHNYLYFNKLCTNNMIMKPYIMFAYEYLYSIFNGIILFNTNIVYQISNLKHILLTTFRL